jgi:thymidine kinase
MFTLEIISGQQGSGKSLKLKEKLSAVGGTLLSMSEIKSLIQFVDEDPNLMNTNIFEVVDSLSKYKTIGVDEVFEKSNFEILELFSDKMNVIVATQRTEKEIESFGIEKVLTLHSCSVRL